MRRCTVGGLGAGLALLLVGPHPADLPADASDLGRWVATDPEHALATAVGLAAWACLLWLCAGGVLAALSALPGTLGRLAGRLARLLLPRLARRLVEVAVGVSLAAGSVGAAAPALASGAGPPVPVTAPPAGPPLGHAWPDLDRPTTGARVVRPGPAPSPVLAPAAPAAASAPPAGTTATAGSGTTTGPPAPPRAPDGAPSASRYSPRSPDRPRPAWPDLDRPAPSDPGPMTGPRRHVPDPEVVVHRGDTLWAIAARHLGPGATDERVAEEWPRWYAANRDVVGADPDLIRPGQRLRPPPAGS